MLYIFYYFRLYLFVYSNELFNNDWLKKNYLKIIKYVIKKALLQFTNSTFDLYLLKKKNVRKYYFEKCLYV